MAACPPTSARRVLGLVEGDQDPAAVGHAEDPASASRWLLCRKANGSLPVTWRRNSAITAEWVKATATSPSPAASATCSTPRRTRVAELGGGLGAGDQVPALLAHDPDELGVAAGAARRGSRGPPTRRGRSRPRSSRTTGSSPCSAAIAAAVSPVRRSGVANTASIRLARAAARRPRRPRAAALVQRRVAAAADQPVGGGRVAGAVADQKDLLGALGSGQRPLEVDLHAPYHRSSDPPAASEESATYGDDPRDDQGVA